MLPTCIEGLPHGPFKAKQCLAWLIASQFHGGEAATRATEAWNRQHVERDYDDVPLVKPDVPEWTEMPAPNFIVAMKLAGSTSQARAVMKANGFKIREILEPVSDPRASITVVDGLLVKYGKKVVRVSVDRIEYSE